MTSLSAPLKPDEWYTCLREKRKGMKYKCDQGQWEDKNLGPKRNNQRKGLKTTDKHIFSLLLALKHSVYQFDVKTMTAILAFASVNMLL